MRSTFALLMIIFIAGCNKSAKVLEGSSASSKASNVEAPYVWGNKTFPKNLRIASNFTAGERSAMIEMADSWQDEVGNFNFFDFGADTGTSYNLVEPDAVLGIYKATTWPAGISEDALAITQLFGRRYNAGDSDEYVSIVHADILVNYAPDDNGATFKFDYNDSNGDFSGFDLRTVVLHELGHFLGLQHIPTWYNREESDPAADEAEYKLSSVMYPSVSSLDSKRIPQLKDINAMAYKYNIGGAGNMIVDDSATGYQPRNDDPGTETHIIMELRKSGECVHKENGAVIGRHFIQKKL